MNITKDSLIVDIFRNYPEAVKVFDKYNMSCQSCLGIQNEKLRNGCMMHGVDTDKFINDLNKEIGEKNGKQ